MRKQPPGRDRLSDPMNTAAEIVKRLGRDWTPFLNNQRQPGARIGNTFCSIEVVRLPSNHTVTYVAELNVKQRIFKGSGLSAPVALNKAVEEASGFHERLGQAVESVDNLLMRGEV